MEEKKDLLSMIITSLLLFTSIREVGTKIIALVNSQIQTIQLFIHLYSGVCCNVEYIYSANTIWSIFAYGKQGIACEA